MPKKQQSKVGGVAFYISLVAMTCLVALILFLLPTTYQAERAPNLLYFSGGTILGAWLAIVIFKGKLSIFIHELKHSIVSNLVGNRAKRLKVKDHSGSFEYEYTDSTSHMNAFIALAPYYFPLATITVLIPAALFAGKNQLLLATALGIGQGLDAILNTRDISPHQSDFSDLRGGFLIGLLYAILVNLLTTGIILTWLVGGHQGVVDIVKVLGLFILKFVNVYSINT